MIAQAIGTCSASIALLCLTGLFAVRVLWPAQDGQHAKRAKHRDHGHEGYADSDARLAELHHLHNAVDFARARRDRITGS